MTQSVLPVSVVIPCYRCKATIDRAIDSIIQQSIRPAEVILIDDASGDGTIDTINALQMKHGAGWLKIISRANNGGPSSARNAGWDYASQDYVAFLDADDAWHPRKLEIQHSWMAAHEKTALTGHAWLRAAPGDEFSALPVVWKTAQISPVQNLLSNRFPTLSVMVRRDLPLRFDPHKRLSEDYLLWCQVLLSGYSGYRIDLPLAHRFKKHHGGHGRLADLWAMEKAELATYSRLREQSLISAATLAFLIPYSLGKFVKRLLGWRPKY